MVVENHLKLGFVSNRKVSTLTVLKSFSPKISLRQAPGEKVRVHLLWKIVKVQE